MSIDDSLFLRVTAQSKSGQTVTKDLGSFPRFVRFKGSQRFGQRDPKEGGDDWLKPSVRSALNLIKNVQFNDFSNMNGGNFLGHASHKNGNDADGYFTGYEKRDKAAANRMIELLNDPNLNGKIQFVFVTFERDENDEFWQAIKDKKLSDGRLARDVIRKESNHTGHFHWRFH